MATKKYVSLSKLSTFLENLKNTFSPKTHTHTLNDLTDYTIDTTLSSTSSNPVQNKVLDAEFDAISEAMGALETAVDDKADSAHTHAISDVDNLQVTIDTINENINKTNTKLTKLDSIEVGAQKNVQSDYAQNDSTKDDYIKNRTHYEISRANEVLVDNVTVDSFAKDGDNDWYVSAANPFVLTITAGKKYKVIFDGVEYECVCETNNVNVYNTDGVRTECYQYYCIGNAQPITPEAQWTNITYPFCITRGYSKTSGELQVFVYNDTATTHTISVIDITPITQKLPLEYMPDGISILRHGSGQNSLALCSSTGSTIASGRNAIAIGNKTQASGFGSVAMGVAGIASGEGSVVMGNFNVASGKYSYAHGAGSVASGMYAIAIGNKPIASGNVSVATGQQTQAIGNMSHTEGSYTIANSRSQHVQGEYNIADTPNPNNKNKGEYLHIVGNGTAENARSNAHTLDWSGNGWFAGEVKIGGTGQNDSTAKTLTTTEYVDTALAQKSQVQIITWEDDD